MDYLHSYSYLNCNIHSENINKKENKTKYLYFTDLVASITLPNAQIRAHTQRTSFATYDEYYRCTVHKNNKNDITTDCNISLD